MSEVLKLDKPVLIDGEKKKEIPFDFDNVTADGIQQAIKQLAQRKHIVTVQEFDPMLHAAIFAQAAQIDFSDVMRLGGKDFLKAGREVRDFFFIDSEDGSEQNTSEA